MHVIAMNFIYIQVKWLLEGCGNTEITVCRVNHQLHFEQTSRDGFQNTIRMSIPDFTEGVEKFCSLVALSDLGWVSMCKPQIYCQRSWNSSVDVVARGPKVGAVLNWMSVCDALGGADNVSSCSWFLRHGEGWRKSCGPKLEWLFKCCGVQAKLKVQTPVCGWR